MDMTHNRTGIIRFAFIMILALMSICASSQYRFPGVDTVIVTPGADGAYVTWGAPEWEPSYDYKYAVIIEDLTTTEKDTITLDTLASTESSVYVTRYLNYDFNTTDTYRATVFLYNFGFSTAANKDKIIFDAYNASPAVRSVNFKLKPVKNTISFKIYEETSTNPRANEITSTEVWVDAYGRKIYGQGTLGVAEGETVSLSGHLGYASGTQEATTHKFIRWMINGVSYYDSTALVLTPTENMNVELHVGANSDVTSPVFQELSGSKVCGYNMVDPLESISLTTHEQLYTVNSDNEVLIAGPDEIMKHITFYKYVEEDINDYVLVDKDACGMYVSNHTETGSTGSYTELSLYNSDALHMESNTQYYIKIVPTVDGLTLCDKVGNWLEPKYCIFNTSPNATQIIDVTDIYGNTYNNGGSQSIGSVWTDDATVLTKEFAIVNTGTTDLTVNNIEISGFYYSIDQILLKKCDGSETYVSTETPAFSNNIKIRSNVNAESACGSSYIPDTLFVRVKLSAPAGVGTGVFNGVLNIKSDDNSGNDNYTLNLTANKFKFAFPYSYQADGTTRYDKTIYQNYSCINDIPSNIQIGGTAPVADKTYYQEYNAYTSEGSCVSDGYSALRAGHLPGNMLTIDVADVPVNSGSEGVGVLTVKWSANGYRKIHIYDNNGTTYLQSGLLPGTECHVSSVVVTSCKQEKTVTKLYVDFEGPEENVLTTVSEISITPCDLEVQSSQADITYFRVPGAKNVRIDDEYIFVEMPAGSCDVTQITPDSISVSPGAMVSPAQKVVNSAMFETSVVSNETTKYFEYLVTAQNNQTKKKYKVYIDCPLDETAGTCYDNTIDYDIYMNAKDQKMEVLSIDNGECNTPATGKGSSHTIHYLTVDDKPLCGGKDLNGDGQIKNLTDVDGNVVLDEENAACYEISGPRSVCIGTVAEYRIANAPESNEPIYKWVISKAPGATDANQFTIVNGKDSVGGDGKLYQTFSGEVLKMKAPTSLEGAVTQLKISIKLDYTDANCTILSGEADAEIYATKATPTQISNVTAGCIDDQGRLLVRVVQPASDSRYEGQCTDLTTGDAKDCPVIEASSYSWDFRNQSGSEMITFDEILDDPTAVYLNLGLGTNTPEISLYITGSNACGVGPTSGLIPVDYATHETEWTGKADNDWFNTDNWTNHVPRACTNVIIRDVSRNTNDKGFDIDETAGSTNEMVFAKAKNYPVIEERDDKTAECNDILFRPGAGVLGVEELTYNRAFVQIDLQRNAYYALTPPLKNMYSGDYYFNGAPEAEMRYYNTDAPGVWDVITKTQPNSWSASFQTLNEPLSVGKAFLYSVKNKVWNFPFGCKDQDFSKVVTFPRMNTDSSLVNVVYPYSAFNGKVFTKMPVYMDKDATISEGPNKGRLKAYRFANEDETDGTLGDFSVEMKEVDLVGNPRMSHLSLAKMYNRNKDLIKPQIKLWNGNYFKTFIAALNLWNNEGDAYKDYEALEVDDTETALKSSALVAPMQAFLIGARNEDALGHEFVITSADYEKDNNGTYNLRSSNRLIDNTMFISTPTTSMCVAMRDEEGINNGCDDFDSYKNFADATGEIAHVYSICDNKAFDINVFSSTPFVVPLGIRTNKKEETLVKLNFSKVESFADTIDVYLINNVTGEEMNLRDESTYTLAVSDSADNTTLQVEFRKSDNDITTDNDEVIDANSSAVQIYVVEGNTIHVASSSANLIESVEVLDMTGRRITKNANIYKPTYDLTLNTGISAVAVRAVTKTGVKIENVLLR